MFPILLNIQLNEYDIAILNEYCKKIKPPNCYLEIGTGEGGSALIAKGSSSEPVYTIDTQDVRKIKDLGIIFIQKDCSVAAKFWKKPIGLLFIDGNHKWAKQDFLDWERHVVKGGYILFHDYIKDTSGEVTVIEDLKDVVMNNQSYQNIHIPQKSDDTETRILVVRKI